jgi:hypothetical protein
MPISLPMITLERKVTFVFLFSLMIPLSMLIVPIWSRIYFWDFSLFAMYFLWIARLSQGGKWTVRLYLFDGFLMVFLVWLCACDVLGLRPEKSFEAWLLWVRSFLIYLYFSRNIGRIIGLKSFLKVILVLILIEGSLSIFQVITQSNFGQINQYFGGYNPEKVPGFWYQGEKYIRSPGTFFNTGIVAEWMVLLLPIVLAWYLYQTKKAFMNIYVIAWFVGLVGAVATLSRSEILCIGFGTFLVLYWNRFITLSGKIKKRVLYFIFIIACLFIGTVPFMARSGYLDQAWHRVQDFSGRFDKKIAYMDSAIQIMEMKPIFGVGQRNFGLLLEETGFPYFHHGEGVVHNIPLLIGAESGYFGFILFVTVILYVVIKYLRRMRLKPSVPRQAVTGGALIGIVCLIADMQLSAGLIHHSLLPLFFVMLGVAFSKRGVYGRK